MNLYIFDLDGTLSDTVSTHKDIFRQVLFSFGIKEIVLDSKDFLNYTDSAIAKKVFLDNGINFNRNILIEVENAMTNLMQTLDVVEIKGAKNYIDKIKRDDSAYLGIATGSLRKPAEYKLKKMGIEINLKTQLVTSSEYYTRDKLILSLISKLKAYHDSDHIERIISFGDGHWDFLTAMYLELEFIGIGDKFTNLPIRFYKDFTLL